MALPARHAFSTRVGGASEGVFSSLNMGASKGDSPDRVRENRRRLEEELGLAGSWSALHQVHGNRAVSVTRFEDAVGEEGDAIVTARSGLPVAVYTADCTPVLLADRHGQAVAAVHAGWRGTAANVAGAAVAALRDLGILPADVIAAIGPGARKCCYEVGDEVVEALEQISPPAPRDDREGWLGQGPERAHIEP
ncbi:MAG: laccase domain-containing protein, partial [Cyanobacteria bacterium REEB65]|nr:laccase domain-containing protein [Cyanobacteria bacterium REEB65]